MANRDEMNKFIDEKLKKKTKTFTGEEFDKRINDSAKKALMENKAFFEKNENMAETVAKISARICSYIFLDMFDEDIEEIIQSQEFVEKFATDSTIDEAIESDVLPDDLKEVLEMFKRLGLPIEIKKLEIIK